jgi:nicotinate-nucleotide pyrophosphorylase (carboxylating)
MVKDNHWAAGFGGIARMVEQARREYPRLAIEIEVDDLAELDLVLPLEVDWILLDNFSVADTIAAVKRRNSAGSPTLLESSGNLTLDSVAGYARAGVEAASVGRLTHSVRALDLGLDLDLDLDLEAR